MHPLSDYPLGDLQFHGSLPPANKASTVAHLLPEEASRTASGKAANPVG